MKRRWVVLGAVAWAVLAGCRPKKGATAVPVPSPWANAAYPSGPPPAATKVFLVAGGDDIANFAAEVVEQRQMWREAGLGDDEIACYWAQPASAEAYTQDKAQYDALRDEVADCYRAAPATVLAHLRAAAEAHPPWLYVFLSAHGLPSLMRSAPPSQPNAARKHRLTPRELADLDHHAVGLQAGPGPVLEDVDGLVGRYRAGTPVRELMVSPPTLAEALSRFDPATPKTVVIQACYAGGFIEDADGPSELAAIGNLTLLTATAHNRPSFGCGAGKARTYYGGAFNRVLAAYLQPGRTPPQLPWAEIHDRVALVVDAIESIDAQRASEPGFLQTPAPVADADADADAENPDDDPGHASDLAHLGRRCGTQTPHDVAHVCGHGGRVAAIVAPGDVGWPLPAEADVLVDEIGADGNRRASRWVALQGNRLWLRELTCANCARQIGIAAVADLPALDDVARTQLRELLGIPDDVPLRTTADWRRFFASAQ